jgi:GMP synthase (glutamine-hydrolysing)
MKKAAIIRHSEGSSIGSMVSVFEDIGLEYEYVEAYLWNEEPDFDPYEPDLLVILGGSMGAYEADDYPFLNFEIDILRKRLERDLPTLGICLGAQLIARALGSEVFPGDGGKEEGWHPLTVHPEGHETPVRHLHSDDTTMLHWHGDTFELPEEAVLLASSAMYENQIFSYGDNVMAFQCHIEGTQAILQRWKKRYKGDMEEMERIIEHADLHIDKMAGQTEKFLVEWIGQVKKGREQS